ncbi:pseudouridine-5'-phosphate glycosidase [soil metagenome]
MRKPRVALETTLLIHGVPRSEAVGLARALDAIVRGAGAEPAVVGVIEGAPVVGMTMAQLEAMLALMEVPKLNSANLGVALARRQTGATTVSTTMELAAAAGVRVFATGGIGGVHKGFAQTMDISADLAAFTRFPVAVVTSGCKSILEVEATREALETLGVPVVGYRCDRFPAFYQRESAARVDARFDDLAELKAFVHGELARTGRGIVVCNPIPVEFEISENEFAAWLAGAEQEAVERGAGGRDATPAVLGALHRISGGRTLRANVELVKSNAGVAGRIA